MTCTGGRLARFLKWNVFTPSPVMSAVIRLNEMRLTIRRSLVIVAVFAILFATPVMLHRRLEDELSVIRAIEKKHDVHFLVVNLSHQPRHSGGYHRMIDGKFVPTAGRAWRNDATPNCLSFLPVSLQIYCFSPITSVQLDMDVLGEGVLDDLQVLRSLKSVSIIRDSPDSPALARMRERFPGLDIHEPMRLWGPLGTKAGGSPGTPPTSHP
ncbi:hypothetical protein Poly51_63240 [Rubripirellula tenax]|uniref:Uncharacterized protein n=1 Tax=Rubripirellula tenax TaxID=2528015 RepID=A0A5C6E3V7_9BACT|nr:hypothetical protein Poly51_63240 [Rubripirellula tenax]